MGIDGIGGNRVSEFGIDDIAIPEIPDVPEVESKPEIDHEAIARAAAAVDRHAERLVYNDGSGYVDDAGGSTFRPPPAGVDPSRYVNAAVPTTPSLGALSPSQVEAKFMSTFASHPIYTNEDAQAIIDKFAAMMAPHGIKVEAIPHARLDQMRITYPDGRVTDKDFIEAKYSDAEIAAGVAKKVQKLQFIPAPGAGGAGGASGGGPLTAGGDISPENQAAFRAHISSYPDGKLYSAVQDWIRARQKAGDKSWDNTIVLHHDLRQDKIQLPNGLVVDVVTSAGSPGAVMGGMWGAEGIHPPGRAATSDLA